MTPTTPLLTAEDVRAREEDGWLWVPWDGLFVTCLLCALAGMVMGVFLGYVLGVRTVAGLLP